MSDPRIRYSVTTADIAALSAHHFETSPHVRRTLLVLRSLVGLLPVTLGVLLALLDRSTAAAFFVVLGLLLFFAVPPLYRNGARRGIDRLATEIRGAFTLGEQIMSIDDEQLLVRSHLGEMRLRWPAIGQITVTDGHLFVYYGVNAALIVPRATTCEGSFDDFARAIRVCREHARANATTPPAALAA
ncbi:MAG: YcxB family protein [Planctomycetota bacterium]|jgi:hypothetical protein